jgi:hypothetical protein
MKNPFIFRLHSEVRARGFAEVRARESTEVMARGYPEVRARGSAEFRARGSTEVNAKEPPKSRQDPQMMANTISMSIVIVLIFYSGTVGQSPPGR